MARLYGPTARALRKKTLPACVAALLAINSMAISASSDAVALPMHGRVPFSPNSVITVTNCEDSGPGSLRDASDNVVNGGAIDLTQLGCSEITLSSGKIAIAVNDVTLLGPGVGHEATHPLTIYGSAYDRIFDHGAGTLTISGLKLTGGHAFARGGCVNSQGSLVIEDSIVTGCEAYVPYGSNVFAGGGAIYTQAELWMHNSVITNNVAYSVTRAAYGGGIFASGIVTIEESTIADNKVIAPQAIALGGGLNVVGVDNLRILNSTISGNEADFGGGMHVDTLGSSQITNSTLSGNHASQYVGAASFVHGPVRLTNSTVTRNSAYAYTAGIYSDQAITVQSSILADNRAVATYFVAYDLAAPSIGGGANLIMSANNITPADTITQCPHLAALKANGGPTSTHAILPGSPGIDVGDDSGLTVDQRGGGYVRVMGANADIGAFEWQGELDDNLFKSAFEVECDRYD